MKIIIPNEIVFLPNYISKVRSFQMGFGWVRLAAMTYVSTLLKGLIKLDSNFIERKSNKIVSGALSLNFIFSYISVICVTEIGEREVIIGRMNG